MFCSVAAMLRVRIAHRPGGLGARMIARIMVEYSYGLSGIDIHPDA